MSWQKVTLTNDQIVGGAELRLQDAFLRLFTTAGAPIGAVMYGTKRIARTRFVFYFTPHAVVIAGGVLAAYSATNCSPPDVSNLVVLAGRLTTQAPD